MRPGDVLRFQAGQEPRAALSWGAGAERDTLRACGVAEDACPGRGQPGPSPNSSWPPGQGTHPERSSGRPSAPSQKCSACTAEWAPRRTNWGSGGGGAGAAMCSPADRAGREQPRAPRSSRWHGRPGSPRRRAPSTWSPCPALCIPGAALPAQPSLRSRRRAGPSPPLNPGPRTGRPGPPPGPGPRTLPPGDRAAAPTGHGPGNPPPPGGLLSQGTDLPRIPSHDSGLWAPRGGAAGATLSPATLPQSRWPPRPAVCPQVLGPAERAAGSRAQGS